MPGRSAYEAYEAFVAPLASALSCIAVAKIQPSQGGKNVLHEDHNLHITGVANDQYVRLKGEPAFELRARMVYRLIEDPRPAYGPLRVTTKSYDYSLRLATGQGVFDYHWHPDGNSHETRPHLHIGSSQLAADGVIAKKRHLHTGRITFESVIRTVIEIGATPLREDWENRLNAAEWPHIQHRSWSIDPAGELPR
jgi:hypothetical protein